MPVSEAALSRFPLIGWRTYPPVGWGDVATKHDLEALAQRLDAKLDARFGGIDARFANGGHGIGDGCRHPALSKRPASPGGRLILVLEP